MPEINRNYSDNNWFFRWQYKFSDETIVLPDITALPDKNPYIFGEILEL